MKNLVLFCVIIFSCQFLGFTLFNHNLTKKKNLVCNSSFENQPAKWHFYIIKANAIGEIDSTEAAFGHNSYKFKENTSGEGFLHSCVFKVNPSTKYSVSVWVKGAGKFQVQVLWWKKYNDTFIDESAQHLKIVIKGNGTSQWKESKNVIEAPSDARKAYIRLIAFGGNVWFDDVNVHQLDIIQH